MTSQLDMFVTAPAEPEQLRHGVSARLRKQSSPSPLSDEDMVRKLEAGGQYRVLRKLVPRQVAAVSRPGFRHLGVVLDTETTGLYHRTDEIIEIGMVAFSFDGFGNIGDVVGEAVVFEIADVSQVWIDLHAFGTSVAKLKLGQAVSIRSAVGEQTAEAKLDRVLPIAAADSQSVIARLHLPNPEGTWRPGLAVGADVVVGTRDVPLAIQIAALQRFRDFTVVFAQVDDTYEVRMLELGARDEAAAEVLGGLAPGTRYVTEQSFLIKADIEKSGASHDH